MPKDFLDKLEGTITSTGKAAAKKAKEVAETAKKRNDIRVAKKDLKDLYAQVGEQYFESHMDYPESDYIDLFNLIEKIKGDIEVLEKELSEDEDCPEE